MICGHAGPMGPGGFSESHGEVGDGDTDVYGLLSLLTAVVSGSADWYQSLMQILVTFQSVILGVLKRQYLQNDYFAGGLGLMFLGFVFASFKSYFRFFWMQLLTSRKNKVSIHVKPEEQAYMWLREWLCDEASKSTHELELQARWDEQDYDDGSGYGIRRQRPRLLYVPKLLEPQHVTFKGQKVTFQTEIGPVNKGGGDGGELAQLLASSANNRALVLTAPSRQVLEDLVVDAMDKSYLREANNGRTCIKRWSNRDAYWTVVATKMARPLESVILDVEVDSLVKDAKHFLSSQKWYNDRGVPHRRGYLLHGPPGTGKTSTVQALAGELGLDVAMVGLSDREMTDENLQCALNRCDLHSIIVLEDIDAAFSANREGGEDKRNSLSFSGLLNAIDGMTAQEGRLVVMTTNHIERLDPALIRPGRVDMRLFLGLASTRQISKLFRRFFPEATEADAGAFAADLPNGKLSPAAVQGYLLLHRDDLAGAQANSAELLSTLAASAEGTGAKDPGTDTVTPAAVTAATPSAAAAAAAPTTSAALSASSHEGGSDSICGSPKAEDAPGEAGELRKPSPDTCEFHYSACGGVPFLYAPLPGHSTRGCGLHRFYCGGVGRGQPCGKPPCGVAADERPPADQKASLLHELVRMAEALKQHAYLVQAETSLPDGLDSGQLLAQGSKKGKAASKEAEDMLRPGPDPWHRLVVCTGGVVLGALALSQKR